MHYPKHKPSTLDETRPGAREDLYRAGENWEGIEAAQKRGNERKSPEQIAESILNRLYERLRIANGATQHRDPRSRKQVLVDPKRTKNLIGNLLAVAKGVKSDELRARIAKEVPEIRVGFRNARS